MRAPETLEGIRPSKRPIRAVGLLGPFGYGNLGDAAIQHAMIDQLRGRLPDVEIRGFSLNPEDTGARHGIPAHPILRSRRPSSALLRRLPSGLRNQRIVQALAQVLLNVPEELALIVRNYRDLRGLDLLVISGGGQLDDYWGGPWGHPYTLYKFARLARAAGSEVAFVSVGAGPLDAPLSRFFVRGALSRAGFRSYRDHDSRRFVQSIGFPNDDPVYPDLAYSLRIDHHAGAAPSPFVALGPMAYFDPQFWPEHDPRIYHGYLEKLAAFTVWLVENGCRVLLFRGESVHDRQAIQALRAKLEGRIQEEGRVFEPAIDGVDTLLETLASAELVVASRYHGVILSHLLEKPVLALSYHPKIDALMAGLGQQDYCLDIDRFDVETMKSRFRSLQDNKDALAARIREKNAIYREALAEQYDRLLHLT